jgi:hypothetical protein
VRARVRGQDIASEPTLPWWPSLLLGGTGATPDLQTEDSAAVFCTPHFPFITPTTVIIAAPPSTACLSPVVCAHPQSRRLPTGLSIPIHSHPLAAVLIGR